MFHVKHSEHIIREHVVRREVLENAREEAQLFREDLTNYLDELLIWNQKINLVSRTVSRETIWEHFVHSLLAHSMNLLKESNLWIDAGTGGGLPGIPLSIVARDKSWILNDNIRKKIAALEQMIQKAGLVNVQTSAGSITLQELHKGVGIVSKHAFKADDLIQKLGKKPWEIIIMWKGAEDAKKEIKKIKGSFFYDLYTFQFGNGEPFYEGKALLVVKRK